MSLRLLPPVAVLLGTMLSPCAAPSTGEPAPPASAESAAELQATLTTLIAETNAVLAETETLEKLLRERDAELARLQETARALEAELRPVAEAPDDPPTRTPTGPSIARKRAELVEACGDRLVFLHGDGDFLGVGFPAPHGEELRIYVAAPLLSGEEAVTVTRPDGTAVPVGTALSCPAGADLVCLHPEDGNGPQFSFAGPASLPGIGDPVVVLVGDPDTRTITGAPGTIRGIGPDTWELDAALTPAMNGAPVLAVDSGEVIGIVTPQVAGVAADWAIGTRHEETRSFAARTDRLGDWQTLDLGRFAKEAAYIDRYRDTTHVAWLAHRVALETLRDPESDLFDNDNEEELREEIEARSGEAPIARIRQWADRYRTAVKNDTDGSSRIDSREALESRLAGHYRTMKRELQEDNRDISDKFTPYHAGVYREARKWRQNGIDEMAAMQDRLTQ